MSNVNVGDRIIVGERYIYIYIYIFKTSTQLSYTGHKQLYQYTLDIFKRSGSEKIKGDFKR